MKLKPADHVFYITSRGYAADHWYAWFVKALNAHPEILAYLANEGSRPKYFAERTRAERPDIVSYTQFLADVGLTYAAIGDCYSYRANKLDPLFQSYGDAVKVVNLVRHPYAWLHYYVSWRVSNMRMPEHNTAALDHEWQITAHDHFQALGLMSYTRDDVEVWTTYQGMYHLNNIVHDIVAGVRQVRLEQLVTDRNLFSDVASYLTHGKLVFADELLDLVYAWVWTPFSGEDKVRVVPEEEFAKWPAWKKQAFEQLHTTEARQAYESIGYTY